jgi:hypothetical protein
MSQAQLSAHCARLVEVVMVSPAGESSGEVLRLDFERRLMLQFLGSVVTSVAGQVAYHELDDALTSDDLATRSLTRDQVEISHELARV